MKLSAPISSAGIVGKKGLVSKKMLGILPRKREIDVGRLSSSIAYYAGAHTIVTYIFISSNF